jgi:hypothetical protein
LFVRFDCGCKGLALPDGRTICIWACDCDERGLGLWFRDLSEKSHTPLPVEEADALIEEIGNLMGDGYRFRSVQSTLGLDTKPERYPMYRR